MDNLWLMVNIDYIWVPKSHGIPQFGDNPTPIDDLYLPSGYDWHSPGIDGP